MDGVEAGPRQHLGDVVGEIAVCDLAGGDVDRDVERPSVGPLIVPLDGLAGRRSPRPSGRSGRSARNPRPPRRTPRSPASRAAGAPTAAGPRARRSRRWRSRPAAGSGAAARRWQRASRRSRSTSSRRAARARISASNSSLRAAAPLLGPVHRRVGVADQRLGPDRLVAGGPADGDPDAGADEVLDAAHRVGLGEGRGDPVGDRDRLVLVGEAVDQDPELVAAETGDDVSRAQVRPQARGDRAQQFVAAMVADAVVDELEAVEVEEQDPDRSPGDGAALERDLERLDEAGPVGEAGERVVQDAVAQGAVGRVALDRVGEDVGRGLGEVDVLRREPIRLERVDVENAERGARARRSGPRDCCGRPSPAAPAASRSAPRSPSRRRSRAGPTRARLRRASCAPPRPGGCRRSPGSRPRRASAGGGRRGRPPRCRRRRPRRSRPSARPPRPSAHRTRRAGGHGSRDGRRSPAGRPPGAAPPRRSCAR